MGCSNLADLKYTSTVYQKYNFIKCINIEMYT